MPREAARPTPATPEAEGFSTSNTLASSTGPIKTSGPPRYHCIKELGRGGMGVVYLALDRLYYEKFHAERQVVLKRILEHRPSSVHRFLTEQKAVAAMDHENIIAIKDWGEDEEGPFLVMAYMEGGNLRQRVKSEGPLSGKAFYEMARGIGRALAYIHERGKIHRDLKPSNILLTREGQPKLADFGLVRIASEVSEYSGSGGIGTADFAAPEQRTGEREVTSTADIYGLGATLYFAITGNSPHTIRESHLPPTWRALVLRCLEEDPDKRFQSASEFLITLEHSHSGSSSSHVISSEDRVICSNCDVSNPKDDKVRFCVSCGAGLYDYCPRCGTLSPCNLRFCGACSYNLVEGRLFKNLLLQASELSRRGKFQEATKKLGAAASIHPDHPDLAEQKEAVEACLLGLSGARARAGKAEAEGMLDLAEAEWHGVLEWSCEDEEALEAIRTLPERKRIQAQKTYLQALNAALETRHATEARGFLEAVLEFLDPGDPIVVDAEKRLAALQSEFGPAFLRIQEGIEKGDLDAASHSLGVARADGIPSEELATFDRRISCMRLRAALEDGDWSLSQAILQEFSRLGPVVDPELPHLAEQSKRLQARLQRTERAALTLSLRAGRLSDAAESLAKLRELQVDPCHLARLEKLWRHRVRVKRVKDWKRISILAALLASFGLTWAVHHYRKEDKRFVQAATHALLSGRLDSARATLERRPSIPRFLRPADSEANWVVSKLDQIAECTSKLKGSPALQKRLQVALVGLPFEDDAVFTARLGVIFHDLLQLRFHEIWRESPIQAAEALALESRNMPSPDKASALRIRLRALAPYLEHSSNDGDRELLDRVLRPMEASFLDGEMSPQQLRQSIAQAITNQAISSDKNALDWLGLLEGIPEAPIETIWRIEVRESGLTPELLQTCPLGHPYSYARLRDLARLERAKPVLGTRSAYELRTLYRLFLAAQDALEDPPFRGGPEAFASFGSDLAKELAKRLKSSLPPGPFRINRYGWLDLGYEASLFQLTITPLVSQFTSWSPPVSGQRFDLAGMPETPETVFQFRFKDAEVVICEVPRLLTIDRTPPDITADLSNDRARVSCTLRFSELASVKVFSAFFAGRALEVPNLQARILQEPGESWNIELPLPAFPAGRSAIALSVQVEVVDSLSNTSHASYSLSIKSSHLLKARTLLAEGSPREALAQLTPDLQAPAVDSPLLQALADALEDTLLAIHGQLDAAPSLADLSVTLHSQEMAGGALPPLLSKGELDNSNLVPATLAQRVRDLQAEVELSQLAVGNSFAEFRRALRGTPETVLKSFPPVLRNWCRSVSLLPATTWNSFEIPVHLDDRLPAPDGPPQVLEWIDTGKHRPGLTFIWIPRRDGSPGFYASEEELGPKSPLFSPDPASPRSATWSATRVWCGTSHLSLPTEEQWVRAAENPRLHHTRDGLLEWTTTTPYEIRDAPQATQDLLRRARRLRGGPVGLDPTFWLTAEHLPPALVPLIGFRPIYVPNM